MSLSIKGGSTIKNRIISSSANDAAVKCPFSVMVYESTNPGQYKAYIEDGEINFTKYYEKNSPRGAAGAEISVTPDQELGLYVVFNNGDYEHNKIKEINVVPMDSSNPTAYATQVVDQGDGTYDITMYIPLAYVYKWTPSGSTVDIVDVKQYWCGNVNFRLYFTTANGELCFEFFETLGLTPGKIPKSNPTP